MATQESPEQRLADVVDRFTRSGYRDTFRAEAGLVRAVEGGCAHPPEELRVEAIELCRHPRWQPELALDAQEAFANDLERTTEVRLHRGHVVAQIEQVRDLGLV